MRSARERVLAAVCHLHTRHQLWSSGAPLVVAVSGGADSLCLLGTLHDLRERQNRQDQTSKQRQNRQDLLPAQRQNRQDAPPERAGGEVKQRQNRQPPPSLLPSPGKRARGLGGPGPLIVAHLDHTLRGADSTADCAFVAALAAELGLPFVAERVDVRALAKAEHRSLEDAARRARYAFLRRVAAEHGAEAIAAGHTRDDQAETILLHLLRGSGLAGLAGMAPRAGDLIRPLLDVSRAETEAYCAERGWQPREDATNRDLHYTRNRIRHELLPLLETFNPSVRATLARNAPLLAADDAYLTARADDAWTSLAPTEAANAITLDLARLRALAPALRTRVYQRAAARLGGVDYRLEARHIAALEDLLVADRAGQTRALPAPLRARRTPTALLLTTAAPSPPAPDVPERQLPVPGMVELPELGWRVRAWLTQGPPGLEGANVPPPPLLPTFARVGDESSVGHAVTRVYLVPDAVAAGPLTVRAWRPGDRFRPMGMPHEKKLQDYFGDAKVPRELRSRLPLIFGPAHLLWIAGLRIDDRAMLLPGASHALALQLEPLE